MGKPSSTTPDVSLDSNEWLVCDSITGRRRAPRLYEFLRYLLEKPQYASYASYIDKSAGVFQIHQPSEVATLWEKIKSRQAKQPMTYEKFARAIRWYYKSGIMVKTNARYTFQFGTCVLETDENNNNIIR